jgi:Protein of unknown function (DUF3592)
MLPAQKPAKAVGVGHVMRLILGGAGLALLSVVCVIGSGLMFY